MPRYQSNKNPIFVTATTSTHTKRLRFMKKTLFLLVPALLILATMTSCRVLNPSIMLKAKKDYPYDTLALDSAFFKVQEYKIAPNDIIEMRFFANNGFEILDLTRTNREVTSRGNYNDIIYTIEMDGTVELPIIGRISLSGYTIRQATDTLEKRYNEFYEKPYIMLQVTNKRVIVYPGNEGASAKVVPLKNNNTTLMEALAASGGVAKEGKAYRIKLVRSNGNPAKPDIYLFDLSTIDNVAQTNIIVQANDVIYVEPRRNIPQEALREISPILTMISSVFIMIALIRR